MIVNTREPMTLVEIAREYAVSLDTLRSRNPNIGPRERVSAFEAPVGFELASLPSAARQATAVRGRSDRAGGIGATPTSPAAGGVIQQRIQQEVDAMDRAAASKALLAQHTTPRPRMSLVDAMARLEPLASGPLDPAKVDSDLQDAALAMLAYRFTPVDLGALDEVDESRAMATTIAAMPHFDEPHRGQLLSDVLFNFAHPAAYQAIWNGLVQLVPPDEMEAALVEHAHSDNELHANNALSLPYYIYGRSPDFTLSDQARADLENAVRSLEQRPGLNSLVRERLAEVRLPTNA